MRIAYYRVSTGDQSIEAQRHAMGGSFDKEFEDVGVSGGTMAADRPGFAKLLEQIRKGDTLCVYAVDRLGRDALDVQGTVHSLLKSGVTVDIRGLGPIAGDAGELVLAVLAQVAQMERRKIRERTEAGRAAARRSLDATGKTHRGKDSLGRPKALDAAQVVGWRAANGPASIAETARRFGISPATVKRYSAQVGNSDPLALLPIAEPSRPTRTDEELDAMFDSPLSQMLRAAKERRAEEEALEKPRTYDPDGPDPLAEID